VRRGWHCGYPATGSGESGRETGEIAIPRPWDGEIKILLGIPGRFSAPGVWRENQRVREDWKMAADIATDELIMRLRRMARTGTRHAVMHVQFSKFAYIRSRPKLLLIQVNSVKDLATHYGAEFHLIHNVDVFVIFDEKSVQKALDAADRITANIFSDRDEMDGDDGEIVHVYMVPRDYTELRQLVDCYRVGERHPDGDVTVALAPAPALEPLEPEPAPRPAFRPAPHLGSLPYPLSTPAPAPAPVQPPAQPSYLPQWGTPHPAELPVLEGTLTPSLVGHLQTLVDSADLRPYIRAQTAYHTANGRSGAAVYAEVFTSMGDLRKTLFPNVHLRGHPNLFQELCQGLDRRVLSLLGAGKFPIGDRQISVNVGVSTLLGPELHDCVKSFSARGLPLPLLEVNAQALLEDIGATTRALAAVKRLGVDIVVDGITLDMFPFLNPDGFQARFYKILSLREHFPLLERSEYVSVLRRLSAQVIFCRCDHPTTLSIGRALAVDKFQGWLIDKHMVVDRDEAPARTGTVGIRPGLAPVPAGNRAMAASPR
jgi:hypothetical protein